MHVSVNTWFQLGCKEHHRSLSPRIEKENVLLSIFARAVHWPLEAYRLPIFSVFSSCLAFRHDKTSLTSTYETLIELHVTAFLLLSLVIFDVLSNWLVLKTCQRSIMTKVTNVFKTLCCQKTVDENWHIHLILFWYKKTSIESPTIFSQLKYPSFALRIVCVVLAANCGQNVVELHC